MKILNILYFGNIFFLAIFTLLTYTKTANFLYVDLIICIILILFPFVRKRIISVNLKCSNNDSCLQSSSCEKMIEFKYYLMLQEKIINTKADEFKSKEKEFEKSNKEAKEILRYIQNEMSNHSYKMPGTVYERYVGFCLLIKGWKDIKYTPYTHDHGADIIAKNPEGIKVTIQCKRYSKTVEVGAVQEVFSAMHYYECEQALVVTNSKFSKDAKDTAQKLDVQLWDNFT